MNSYEKNREFRQAVAKLMQMLPGQQNINTALLLKAKPVSRTEELLLVLADKSELSWRTFQDKVDKNFRQSAINKQSLIMLLDENFHNRPQQIQFVARVEYRRWERHPSGYIPFSHQEDSSMG